MHYGTIDLVFQVIVNGLIAGAVYSLVAAGFSLIYSTCKFIHFALGATAAFSVYVLFFLFSVLNFSFGISVILAILLGCFLGYLMNILVYKPLRERGARNVLLIASFALSILLESLLLIFFGPEVRAIDLIKVQNGLNIFGAIITPLQIVIIFISITLLIFLFWLMKKTKLGKAMRAISDNKDIAEIMGISSEKIYILAFIAGSAIVGVAGILLGLDRGFEPTIGSNIMIKGFTAAIVGGIDSVYGAVLGAFLLGIIENFGILFLPSGYKDAIAFGILFIFLLFRPNGILGIRKGEIDK